MGTRRIWRNDGEFTLFFRKVSPFSNHHPAEFVSDGAINCSGTIKFSCTEQFYMFNKASLLNDDRLMKAVLEANSPRAMKSMCSKGALRGWNDAVWDQHKESVMYTACSAKFRFSRHLRYVLFLSTGSRLIECSPFDTTWGIGKDIEAAQNSSMNSGRNLLGTILDRVREELWNDANYQDEREEVEKRSREDKNYLLHAMEQVDLLYKERAKQRYLISQGRALPDENAYLTPKIRHLLPEWAFPPPLGNIELICPSPPQIIHFERSVVPNRARSASPPLQLPAVNSRLYGRLTVSEMRPTRKITISRSNGLDRSCSRERNDHHRKRRRSRSRSRSSSSRRDKGYKRKRSRSRSRSKSPINRKERRRRQFENRDGDGDRDRRRDRSRSRDRHHHSSRKSNHRHSESKYDRRRRRRSSSSTSSNVAR
uniref:NADAR domain-containing protein n=1 Tax=Caenorhabditis japonica TaxID=281687 RepID=A0A8R1DP30_CAEJA